MNVPKSTNSTTAITELIDIVSQLRSPKGGCPWDIEQTHTSLIPYLLEEAHEVADAIRNNNDDHLQEELGDLLLQIFLHSQIANEEKRFNLEDIARGVSQKMIRRHPHVFGNTKVKNTEEAKKNWESIKMLEKPLTTSKSQLSDHLKEKVRSQSAISGAMEISKKVANAGFEWESIDSIWDKVNEELSKLKKAIDQKDFSNAQEELGDVIFTLINIARWCKLSPEEGLAGTNRRFLDRFSHIESTLEGDISSHSFNVLREAWNNTKENIHNLQKK